MAEWRAVGGLGKAPKLTYLTLFFNPVCKRKMYRPFTTNCCESLRGLDLHAVSDEEVVEGANFFKASRFRTCSSALALPQPLFRGLTELNFSPTQHGVHGNGHHPVCRAPDSDAISLARVLRRIQFLRKFHARNSPVIIGQRQVRRFLREIFGVAAAVKIQTHARKWIVQLRSVAALKDILRKSGELYLVQVSVDESCDYVRNVLVLSCRWVCFLTRPPCPICLPFAFVLRDAHILYAYAKTSDGLSLATSSRYPDFPLEAVFSHLGTK